MVVVETDNLSKSVTGVCVCTTMTTIKLQYKSHTLMQLCCRVEVPPGMLCMGLICLKRRHSTLTHTQGKSHNNCQIGDTYLIHVLLKLI